MKVLVACEYSGRVRDAFIRMGHDAMSCDILPTESEGPHYQGDVLDILDQGWDLMIAHPPCTYLSNSGSVWLYKDETRWEKMRQGAEFFKKLLEADIPMIAVENPIMHKHGVEIIGRRQDQIIQPWQHGHGEQKATGLWLKNLPLIEPTNIVEGRYSKVQNMGNSKQRAKRRSLTYLGIAEAMAQQWGKLD